MKIRNLISKLAFMGIFSVVFGASLIADETKRDNSAINARDMSVTEVTADNQSTERADTEVVRKIRKDINDRAGLSTYAKNVKIIAEDGKVTLKGPVRTQAEKNTVASIASRVAGAKSVVNELEIVPME